MRPRSRRLELAPARFPPRHGLRIRAPALGLEVLVDMSRLPCGFGREKSPRDGEREQPDPVSVVIDDWLKSFSAFGLGQELVGQDADCCQSNVRRGQITKNGSGRFSIADCYVACSSNRSELGGSRGAVRVCPLNVDSRRRSNVSNAQIAVIGSVTLSYDEREMSASRESSETPV